MAWRASPLRERLLSDGDEDADETPKGRKPSVRRERSMLAALPSDAVTFVHLEECIRQAEDTSKTTEWMQQHIENLVRAPLGCCGVAVRYVRVR